MRAGRVFKIQKVGQSQELGGTDVTGAPSQAELLLEAEGDSGLVGTFAESTGHTGLGPTAITARLRGYRQSGFLALLGKGGLISPPQSVLPAVA